MVLHRRLDRGAALIARALLAWLCAATLVACASAPPPQGERRRTVLLSDSADIPSAGGMARRDGELSTPGDDARVGGAAADQVAAQMGLLGDPELDAYVTRVGERLLRGIPRQGFRYTFSVVDQVEPNAFALPGGHIFVSRGLLVLVESEDELACALGHEITHAASRHAAAQQAAAAAQNPLTMPWIRAANMAAYSRDMERSADRGGQLLAAAAGYDPMGMSTFLARLALAERLETGPRGPSFFDTHPGSVERASVNAMRADEMRWQPSPSRGDTKASHLAVIEGMPVGARPETGVFQGSLFLHPELGFQIRFPSGWRLQNAAQAVGAMSPQRDAVVYLTADLPPGELQQVAEGFVQQELQGSARIRDSRPVKLGSLDAWRLEFEAPGRGGGTEVLSTFFAFRDSTWRVTGLSPAALAERHRGRILATARSFRPIDRAEAAKIAPTKLHVVSARAGEDIEALSARTGNQWSPIRTAVSNGVDSHVRFAGGEKLKIAVKDR